LPLTPPGRLPRPSRSSSSQTPLMSPLLRPEDSRALGPFLFHVSVCWLCGLVNRQITLL
jgi:hypothetical protein